MHPVDRAGLVAALQTMRFGLFLAALPTREAAERVKAVGLVMDDLGLPASLAVRLAGLARDLVRSIEHEPIEC